MGILFSVIYQKTNWEKPPKEKHQQEKSISNFHLPGEYKQKVEKRIRAHGGGSPDSTTHDDRLESLKKTHEQFWIHFKDYPSYKGKKTIRLAPIHKEYLIAYPTLGKAFRTLAKTFRTLASKTIQGTISTRKQVNKYSQSYKLFFSTLLAMPNKIANQLVNLVSRAYDLTPFTINYYMKVIEYLVYQPTYPGF